MSLPHELATVRQFPSTYLSDSTYASAVGLVEGYDIATLGGLLAGFREWLIVQLRDGNNLGWPALVLKLMQSVDAGEERSDESAIEFLFATLDSFLTLRKSRNGIRRIFAAYEDWLSTTSWYGPSSPDWIEPV